MKSIFHFAYFQLISLLSVVFISLTFTSYSAACECYQKNNFEQEFARSKVVFLGEVIAIDYVESDSLVTLKIEKIWKGGQTKTIIIRTDNRGKACGFVFKTGERYLVYAEADGEALRTNICSRTSKAAEAAEDLAALAGKHSSASLQ